VAWHERVFFDKNQAEIGTLLGKSSDWVSVRSRVYRLPDTLKEQLRQRPRAISQMLELGVLYTQQSEAALELADRVVHENLTLDALRVLIRGYARPERHETPLPGNRVEGRRGAATSVQDVTSEPSDTVPSNAREGMHKRRGAATQEPGRSVPDRPTTSMAQADEQDRAAEQSTHIPHVTADATSAADLALLQEAVATLASVASRADTLPGGVITTRVLDQVEQALVSIRRTLVRRTLPEARPPLHRFYQFVDTDLREVLVLLRRRHPVVATIRSREGESLEIHLLICLLPKGSTSGGLSNTNVGDLFVAVTGANGGTVPLINGAPAEWVRNGLGLTQDEAATMAAFVSDLAQGLAGEPGPTT
jgi:hypothetical protein